MVKFSRHSQVDSFLLFLIFSFQVSKIIQLDFNSSVVVTANRDSDSSRSKFTIKLWDIKTGELIIINMLPSSLPCLSIFKVYYILGEFIRNLATNQEDIDKMRLSLTKLVSCLKFALG